MKTTFLLCFAIFTFTLDLSAQKLEVLFENEIFYLVDKFGAKQNKTQYNYIYKCAFSKDFAIAEKEKLYLVNLISGKITELAEYMDNLKIINDTCFVMNDDFVRFKEKNKIGLMKLPNKIVLPAEYNDIYPKADAPQTFFLLSKNKNWQFYYPQTGKFSVLFKEMNPSSLYIDNRLSYLPDNEAVLVKVNDDVHLMKSDGTDFTLDKFFSKNKDLNIEGMSMILCIKDSKYGYVDQYANVLVPFTYEWAEPMEGTAIVKYHGKFGTIRDNGQQVIPCVYDKLIKKSPEIFEANKEGKTIKLLENGNPYDEMMTFEDNNKFRFASEDQTIKVPGTFEAVKPFRYGLAPVKNAGKWGYIVPTGQLVITNQFEDAAQFNANTVAAAKLNGKWGIIDFTGKFIYEPKFDSIDSQEESALKLINKTGIYEFGTDKKIKVISIFSEKGSFTDQRDGKPYKTVKICNQTWMAQNLDFKTEESFYYDNKESNASWYGRLYTWKAALMACPTGWHLPSDEDWKILERTLGMPEEQVNSTDYTRGPVQAPMMQAGGSTGFDIQLSGFLHGYDNNFYKLGEICITWTSTPNGSDNAWSRTFYPQADMISRDNNTYVKYGLPVRCMKN
jgi:uncharacterized protein (TIGR02145 family)